MKLFVVAAVLGVCAADVSNKYLPPRGNSGGFGGNSFGTGSNFGGHSGAGGNFGGHSGAGGNFGGHSGAGGNFGGGAQGYSGSGGYSGATQYSGNAYNAGSQNYRSNPADVNAQILRSNSEVTAEGFAYDFETSNGIRADASGVATNGVQSHGSFAYKGDDGQDYSITYTADENGYRPQGAHLPTPPPIPEEILKSLEQNARDEAAGISDDGQYRGEGAGAGGYSGHSGAGAGAGGYSAGAPSNQYGAPARNFGGAGAHGSGNSGFGGAASRQYLAPNAGRPSGNGNFNTQSGYQY